MEENENERKRREIDEEMDVWGPTTVCLIWGIGAEGSFYGTDFVGHCQKSEDILKLKGCACAYFTERIHISTKTYRKFKTNIKKKHKKY